MESDDMFEEPASVPFRTRGHASPPIPDHPDNVGEAVAGSSMPIDGSIASSVMRLESPRPGESRRSERCCRRSCEAFTKMMHPDLFHHGSRGAILRVVSCEDPIQPEVVESEGQGSPGPFGGQSQTPVLPIHEPSDLGGRQELIGFPHFRQPDPPDEGAIVLQLRSPVAETLCFPDRDVPVQPRVGLLASIRSAEVPHHLGVCLESVQRTRVTQGQRS